MKKSHWLPFGVCDLEYHYLTSFLWLQAIGDGLIDSQVLEMWYISMYLSDPVCLKRSLLFFYVTPVGLT
jgi:hypothetical protein